MYKRIPPTVVPAKAGIHKTRRPILIREIRFKHNLQGLWFEPDRPAVSSWAKRIYIG
jgi:hypothetical protein